MALSPGTLFPLLHQAHDTSPLIVLTVLNVIDALANQIQAESALPAAVKDRCRRRLRIERRAGVPERHARSVVIHLNGQDDRLVLLARIAVQDNVRRRFGQRQRERVDPIFIGRPSLPALLANFAEEGPHRREVAQVTVILLLSLHHIPA
jgi:hypothetical protein